MSRFVGQSVARREDPRLLTGRGNYVDDVQLKGMVHAAFVRSDVARGKITDLDTSAARSLPGVVGVFGAEELNASALEMRISGAAGTEMSGPPLRPFADGDVRFVGEPIAIVVAESRYVAEDAVELVEVTYETQPAVLNNLAAIAEDEENLVHPELGTNVASAMAMPNEDVDNIFEEATHVASGSFSQQRQSHVPMECRGIVASWLGAENRIEVHASTQNPHEFRLQTAQLLGIPENAARIISNDVGGGFGQKVYLSHDEMCVILASRVVDVPLKWIEDRRENLLASGSARRDDFSVSLAADEKGQFLAGRIAHYEECGAFPEMGNGGAGMMVAFYFPGPYKLPLVDWSTTSVWSNTVGRQAYRGPWLVETLARERIVDELAAEMGIDPLELRRRNVIHDEDLPHQLATGPLVDNVTCDQTLEQAAAMIGYEDFRSRQADLRAEGRLVGIGLSLYIEPGAFGFGALGVEAATVRVLPNGTVNVTLGTGNHGQGLETTMAQVVADELGMDVDDIIVKDGDTDSSPYGSGTIGSRSAVIAANAAVNASGEVREKMILIAAELLEAGSADLVIGDGRVMVQGVPDRGISVRDVARAAHNTPDALPEGTAPGLEATARYQAPPVTFSNSCHACIVEVDPVTGIVEIQKYVVSEDCGNMINPMVVEGQIAGGVAQGIGGALFENMLYDAEGNPLATTFLDYLLPTAADVPDIEYGHIVTESPVPGGYKGMAEGGAIGAPAAVANAVADALRPLGAKVRNLPLGPSEILDLISSD